MSLKTRKARGGPISGGGGGLQWDVFFGLQVVGPITGGAYKRGS